MKKRKKLYLSISILLVFLGILLFFNYSSELNSSFSESLEKEAWLDILNSKEIDSLELALAACNFKTELARSKEEQYKGLSGRESLAKDEALLFLYKKAEALVFVMREMRFPIDIVFLRDRKVIQIYENLEPEGREYKNYYPSLEPATEVLELAAGQVEACGIYLGDNLYILKP